MRYFILDFRRFQLAMSREHVGSHLSTYLIHEAQIRGNSEMAMSQLNT